MLKILKFPLWLLKLFTKKPRKKRTEREEKQRKHVWNFDSTRLKNRSWQKSVGKKKKLSRKKRKSITSAK